MNVVHPPAASRTLEQNVQLECLREQYAKSPLPSLGVAFVALLCAVPGWFYLPRAVEIGYVASMFGYQALMLGLSQWVYRQRRYGLSLRQIAHTATFIYAVNGTAVGISSIVLYRAGGEPMFLFAVLVQLGLAAGSLGTSAYHPPAMLAYLLTSTPIFGLELLLRERSFVENVVGVGLLFNMLYVIAMGWEQSRSIRSAIRLRFENDALLKQLRLQTSLAEQARQESELASEEKSHFFASASHDLRQPVHALNIYASLLRTTTDPEERAEVLRRVGTCVTTLDDLFNALLTVSRAEGTDNGQVPVVPVPLQAAIDSAVTQYQPLAAERGLELRGVATSVWVQGERIAIERMIGNLLSNAIRFTPQGKVRVGVRRRGDEVELQVLDTGVGIAEDQRQRIFEEFYQVSNPGRHADRGFGLGLVIVQRLCRAYGYRVAVRSKPSRGTCFSLRLPRAHPRPSQILGPVRQNPSIADARVHALLVDDDATVRDAMARVLREWGTRVDICASSAEAYAMARERGADWNCLLLDQRLDEATTGVELAGQLRALLHRPIPVAILTGEEAGTWTLDAQSQGYTVLAKPVKLIRLRAFIAATVGQPRVDDTDDHAAPGGGRQDS